MNTQPEDTRSFIEPEHETPSTWKVKAGRMYKSVFRSRSRSHDATPTATTSNDISPGPSSSPSSSLQPQTDTNPSNTSSRTPRHRRYINVWIRAPPKDTSSPSSSSSSSSSHHGLREEYRNAFKDRVVRKHVTICTVSGLLLLSLLPLYSVFGRSYNNLNGQTYHIFFLLLIMVFAIIFCHSLARSFLLATHIVRHGNNSITGGMRRIPSVVGPLGYAQPAHPIHVVLARDEEIALEEGEDVNRSFGGASRGNNNDDDGNIATSTPKLAAPPPAYGLWRNSVRINPNLLYWQRVEASNTTTAAKPDDDNGNQIEPSPSNYQQSNTTTNATTSIQHRPPSYASDDGVEYVVEAQPRSTVSHYRTNS